MIKIQITTWQNTKLVNITLSITWVSNIRLLSLNNTVCRGLSYHCLYSLPPPSPPPPPITLPGGGLEERGQGHPAGLGVAGAVVPGVCLVPSGATQRAHQHPQLG